jgi:streptomycin 6-kinase
MDSNLKENIIKIYGDKGKQWLDSLPEIIIKVAKEHILSGLNPVNNMTFNYVASGYQTGWEMCNSIPPDFGILHCSRLKVFP